MCLLVLKTEREGRGGGWGIDWFIYFWGCLFLHDLTSHKGKLWNVCHLSKFYIRQSLRLKMAQKLFAFKSRKQFFFFSVYLSDVCVYPNRSTLPWNWNWSIFLVRFCLIFLHPSFTLQWVITKIIWIAVVLKEEVFNEILFRRIQINFFSKFTFVGSAWMSKMNTILFNNVTLAPLLK